MGDTNQEENPWLLLGENPWLLLGEKPWLLPLLGLNPPFWLLSKGGLGLGLGLKPWLFGSGICLNFTVAIVLFTLTNAHSLYFYL